MQGIAARLITAAERRLDDSNPYMDVQLLSYRLHAVQRRIIASHLNVLMSGATDAESRPCYQKRPHARQ